MTTQSILKYHIIPFFGEMVLGKIGSREIDRYKSKQRQLKHRMGVGYAPKTINNQLSVLHRIFERAVAYKLITENPLKKNDWMKRAQTAEDQMRFLSIAEQQLLIQWMDKNWGEPHPDRRLVVMILLATGIRFSEIRALEKQDVDLAQALLKITRSVARTQVSTPKGKVSRTQSIPEGLIPDMLRWMLSVPGQLLFPADNGGYLENGVVNRWIARACKGAGIQRITCHGLRHTVGATCAYLGFSQKVIGANLGHQQLTTTERYVHLQKDFKRDVVERIWQTIAPGKCRELV